MRSPRATSPSPPNGRASSAAAGDETKSEATRAPPSASETRRRPRIEDVDMSTDTHMDMNEPSCAGRDEAARKRAAEREAPTQMGGAAARSPRREASRSI